MLHSMADAGADVLLDTAAPAELKGAAFAMAWLVHAICESVLHQAIFSYLEQVL